MTNEEYIEQYPHLFKDDIDKWLFKEFNISGGRCSSIESMKYSVAREVAEKAMEYTVECIMKEVVEGTVKHKPNDYGEYDPYIYIKVSRDYKEGSKVYVLILKDESEYNLKEE